MINNKIKERNKSRLILKHLIFFFVTFLCSFTFTVSNGSGQTVQNGVHTGISHTFWYSDQSDLIMNSPHQMDNTWFFAVINLPDVGADVVVTEITANTSLPIIWHDAPSSSSPPNFEWDLNVTIPEGYVDTINGHITPDISQPPFVMYSRMVEPAILSGSETFQEVNIVATFNSLPSADVTKVIVNVGLPTFVGNQPLVTTEVTEYNAPLGWNSWISGQSIEWDIHPDDLEFDVPYNFSALVKSTKSIRLIGDPVYKPFISVIFEAHYPVPDSSTGTSHSLSHPGGVDVTFQTADPVEWLSNGIYDAWTFVLGKVISDLIPCGDNLWCVPVPEDRDNDGIYDIQDNCPYTPNSSQEDSDEDGIGDACDTQDNSTAVEIDIKPCSDPNSINLKAKGLVPVAVLTNDNFDAMDIDPITVKFADAGPVNWTVEDVGYDCGEDDGDVDLLLFYKTQELILNTDSTEAELFGYTVGGVAIEAADMVKIVH